MQKNNIDKLIKKINDLDDIVKNGKTGLEFVYHSEVRPPIYWKLDDFEKKLHVTLPKDLISLWKITSEVHLFEDISFRQWGTIIWSPDQVLFDSPKLIDGRSEDHLKGDLVIGKFCCDQEYIILRCDTSQSDFGSIVIRLEIDKREEWPMVASSLSAFIDKSIKSPEDKFWEK